MQPQASSPPSAGEAARQAGREELSELLLRTRQDSLNTFAVVTKALTDQGRQVPQQPTVNLPLWELGHVGWFQEWWTGRNPHLHGGVRADPDVARNPPVRRGSDALYNSSLVPHATRWSLDLPDADETRWDMDRQLAQTLTLLAGYSDESDDALYFFRLALLHEDMHHEAALYMAQALGLDQPDLRWRARTERGLRAELALDAGLFRQGHEGPGFAFDNELPAHDVDIGAYRIDRRALNWSEFLPFVEAGGYSQTQWWSDAGKHWLQAHQPDCPAVLRRADGSWQQRQGSRWLPLMSAAAACHLNLFEAQAWCAWAGRRLPTEAEWERAAVQRPQHFSWGQVWEWTASPFAPYPGFQPHPYRDYSAPWFDGRPVLKGASRMTQPRMQHPRYRNYFTAERTDLVSGFRSCAL